MTLCFQLNEFFTIFIYGRRVCLVTTYDHHFYHCDTPYISGSNSPDKAVIMMLIMSASTLLTLYLFSFLIHIIIFLLLLVL
jgi:hypothetical protein